MGFPASLTCTACPRVRADEPEMFKVTGRRVDGTPTLHPKCKPCQNEYYNTWQKQNLQKKAAEQCPLPGCTRPMYFSGMCRSHYDKRRRANPKRFCSILGCHLGHSARGYCLTHLHRVRRTGSPGTNQRLRAANGEGWINADGYRKITVDGTGILEHRHVMEKILGRSLLKTENVHHVNGVRLDNRLENLELWSTSQPSGQRVADKVAWAREFLALYAGQELLIGATA